MPTTRKHVDFEVLDWREIPTGLRAVRFTLRPTAFRPVVYRPPRLRPEAVSGLTALDPERLRPQTLRATALRPNNLRPEGGADLVGLAQLGQVNQTLRPAALRGTDHRPEFFRPQPGSGSVAMHQRSEAAFPDRPAALNTGPAAPSVAATGARVLISAGQDGRYLEHTLPAPAPVLHARLLIRPGTATGGVVTVLQALDDTGHETLRLTYDTTARRVTATIATHEITGSLAAALSWHTVEVKLDTLADQAQLWVNGRSVDTATGSGDFTPLQTRSVRFGAIYKQSTLTGALALDEWVTDTAYVGPVPVAPTATHAADPARWLVIYNTATDDSVTWVEAYRQARRVPFANLLGLALPTDEAIDETQWTALRDAVFSYLTLNHLSGQIAGLLVGYGVPGVATVGGNPRSVASLLADLNTDTTDLTNPRFIPGTPTAADLPPRDSLATAPTAGPYLVADMNAPTLTDALAAIDNAAQLTTLTPTAHALTALDASHDHLAAAAAPSSWPDLDAWLGSIGPQTVKLPLDPAFDGSAHGASIEFTDATDGLFTITGQTRALLATSSPNTADAIRTA